MPYVLIICLLIITHVANAAVVVVNAAVSQTEMTKDQARDLLLGRTNTYTNGQNAILVLCMENAADVSIKEITGRNASLLLRGWKRLVFSGSGAMPLQSATIAESIALVARTPRAMVVLPTINDVPAGCRIITLQEK